MKLIPLAFAALLSTSALAALPDYVIEGKGLANSCAISVLKKLQADREVASYLEDKMTVSLEWYDEEKTEVSFTFNFGEDVRDGYMTGRVAVKAGPRGACQAIKVTYTSVGD